MLLQGLELTSSTPAWAHRCEPLSSLCVHMRHPSQQKDSSHSLQEKHCVAQKLWSSWIVLLQGHQPFRMDSRCFSVSADELISNEPLCPTTKRFKSLQNLKCTDLKRTNTKSPLQLGKHCLATVAVLLDTEDSLAKLCRCPAVRCAQTSRMRPGNFYLPQISYVKMAEAKLSISAQTEHLKKPYPPESHN